MLKINILSCFLFGFSANLSVVCAYSLFLFEFTLIGAFVEIPLFLASRCFFCNWMYQLQIF